MAIFDHLTANVSAIRQTTGRNNTPVPIPAALGTRNLLAGNDRLQVCGGFSSAGVRGPIDLTRLAGFGRIDAVKTNPLTSKLQRVAVDDGGKADERDRARHLIEVRLPKSEQKRTDRCSDGAVGKHPSWIGRQSMRLPPMRAPPPRRALQLRMHLFCHGPKPTAGRAAPGCASARACRRSTAAPDRTCRRGSPACRAWASGSQRRRR
jgi:hypothetical protein